MLGCADYTVSILHVVDLLGRNGMRLVGVLQKTDEIFLFFILTLSYLLLYPVSFPSWPTGTITWKFFKDKCIWVSCRSSIQEAGIFVISKMNKHLGWGGSFKRRFSGNGIPNCNLHLHVIYCRLWKLGSLYGHLWKTASITPDLWSKQWVTSVCVYIKSEMWRKTITPHNGYWLETVQWLDRQGFSSLEF